MACDVHEQVFNESQFYAADVLGEDGGDEGAPGYPIALPGICTNLSKSRPSESQKDDTKNHNGAAGQRLSANAPSAAKGGVREKRRKRAAERATKIVFWLETKYDILGEVCSSLDNWKEAPNCNYDFDLYWCDTAIAAERFMKLKLYQKMNHFVGMSSITRKNNLGRNLLRMRKQFPKEYKFFPDTWILPTDLSDFKMQFTTGKKPTFIIKPDNGCQGKGIFLVRDVEKVPVDFSTTYVAQRYIHKPFLLEGYKFDLRLYVLVLGCDPLRIFLHKRGLVRLASEQYVEPSGKNIQQSMVHLTNYAINKLNPNFEENTDPDDAKDGHKRSWEAVQAYLRNEGFEVDSLNTEIEDLIVKTLIAVQPSLSHFYRSCQPDDIENAMCFEILGFDVMLDYKLQPWLLEVNHAPSFAAESELDRVVKTEVLRDSFELLNLHPEARRLKKREAREKMEQRAMGVSKKTSMEERMALELESALERTAWEDEHLTSYKRLYPSEEKELEYMYIHDAAINIWEMLMGGTSRRTIRLTQQVPPPKVEEEDQNVRKSSKGDGQADKKEKEKRTPEQLKEVMERLMAGCSARPRPSEMGRGRHGGKGSRDGSGAAAGEELDELKEDNPPAASKANKPDVNVGDVVKVQTNIGWETVTIRAKRTNGKLDIQFKDGEYMRAVLPRLMKEPNNVLVNGVGQGADVGSASLIAAPNPIIASFSCGTAMAADVVQQPEVIQPGHALAGLNAGVAVPPVCSSSWRAPALSIGPNSSCTMHGAPSSLAAGRNPPPLLPFGQACEGSKIGSNTCGANADIVPASHEVAASLSHHRPRRSSNANPHFVCSNLDAPANLIAPPPANVATSRPAAVVRIAASPAASQQDRVHEARLRQHLQQLINIRPIIARRAGVSNMNSCGDKL